MSEMRN